MLYGAPALYIQGIKMNCCCDRGWSVHFLDRISRCSQGLEGVQFVDHMYSSSSNVGTVPFCPGREEILNVDWSIYVQERIQVAEVSSLRKVVGRSL